VEFVLEHVAEVVTAGEFPTLISTDAAPSFTKLLHESSDYFQWRLFGLCEEYQQAARFTIDDNEVRAISVI
jgi:hypothetical protein